MASAFWLGRLKRSSKRPLTTNIYYYAKWPQDERKTSVTKHTSNPSAFELIVFQVFAEVLCAQSPAYHELAL